MTRRRKSSVQYYWRSTEKNYENLLRESNSGIKLSNSRYEATIINNLQLVQSNIAPVEMVAHW